jgi:hypothetical protein
MEMATGVIAEMKRHPYTSLSALGCLCICGVALPFMWSRKADAADVQGVKEQVAEVRADMRREFATAELKDVRRELFDLDLRIRTLERENINVDQLLYRRRDDLLAQQRLLEARLQAMDRSR